MLNVIATPGHSPGSLCYEDRLHKRLFSGDTLFQGTHGRVDLPGSNSQEMRSSLGKLSLLPSDTEVFPGHGDSTTIANELEWMQKRRIL